MSARAVHWLGPKQLQQTDGLSRDEHSTARVTTTRTPTCLSLSVAQILCRQRAIHCDCTGPSPLPTTASQRPRHRLSVEQWVFQDKWLILILIQTGHSFHSVIKDLKPNNKWHVGPFRTLVINSRQTRFVITFRERACSFRLSEHGDTSCYNSYFVAKRPPRSWFRAQAHSQRD